MKKGSAITQWLLFLIIFFTAFGVCCGVIWGSSLSNEEYNMLTAKIEIYQTIKHDVSRMDAFKDALFKYGKTTVYIWFLGFIPIGSAVSLCILFSKGIGVGFTASALLNILNTGQATEIILSYTLQCLVMFPVYILLTYKSIDFIRKYFRQNEEKYYITVQTHIVNYTSSYVVCCLPIILACITEAFILSV